MLEALWIVRQFPRQILRDLHRFHNGLKLADWWRATRDANGHLALSSYELLTYLDFMDDEGAFKTDAERGGAWTDAKRMLAELANEQYRMRASYHLVEGGERARFDPSIFEFVDPVMRAARQRAAEEQANREAQSQATFDDAMGYA